MQFCVLFIKNPVYIMKFMYILFFVILLIPIAFLIAIKSNKNFEEEEANKLCKNVIFRNVADPNFCDIFHLCINGKLQLSYVCPVGTAYDEEQNQCLPLKIVDCGDKSLIQELSL
uniref:ORF5 n=1 Tax=Spodoptera litura multicapsid nucleopolyhedrovirus TaxID=46242 RepID=D5K692_NPVST|nr:ORF5 [Spodoptera litura nucleopolyhedrovirus]